MIRNMALRRMARQGFTLTEITIVLGIVGVVAGGIWAAADMVRYNRMIQQQRSDLLVIVSGMRNLYAGKAIPAATDTNQYSRDIVKFDIFPNDARINAAGDPVGREAGTMKVWPQSNSPAASDRVFEVEFFGTPRTCQRLAYETSRMTAPNAPLYIFTNTSGWVLPADSTMATFDGCAYVSWAFSL